MNERSIEKFLKEAESVSNFLNDIILGFRESQKKYKEEQEKAKEADRITPKSLKYKGNKTRRVELRMHPEAYDMIKKYADDAGVSFNCFVNSMVEMLIEVWSEGDEKG